MTGHRKVPPEPITHGDISTAGLYYSGTTPNRHYAPIVLRRIKLPVANAISRHCITNVIGGKAKLIDRHQNLAINQLWQLGGDLPGYVDISAIYPQCGAIGHGFTPVFL
jgi:hypothetical protein